jgi:hypothetical protein
MINFKEDYIMDERTMYRLQSLMVSAMYKLTRVEPVDNNHGKAWYNGAFADLDKALELIEKEIDSLDYYD